MIELNVPDELKDSFVVRLLPGIYGSVLEFAARRPVSAIHVGEFAAVYDFGATIGFKVSHLHPGMKITVILSDPPRISYHGVLEEGRVISWEKIVLDLRPLSQIQAGKDKG